MGTTFGKLLEQLVDVRDEQYRDDVERDKSRLLQVEYTLQTMLEMLRDRFDPS